MSVDVVSFLSYLCWWLLCTSQQFPKHSFELLFLMFWFIFTTPAVNFAWLSDFVVVMVICCCWNLLFNGDISYTVSGITQDCWNRIITYLFIVGINMLQRLVICMDLTLHSVCLTWFFQTLWTLLALTFNCLQGLLLTFSNAITITCLLLQCPPPHLPNPHPMYLTPWIIIIMQMMTLLDIGNAFCDPVTGAV